MKSLLLAVLLILQGSAQEAPLVDVPEFHTWVNQTAVWPGDVVDYSVQVSLAPRIELSTEDLSGAGVAWEPFHLLSFARSDETRPDGFRVVTLTYRLVAVDAPEAGWADIPAFRLPFVERAVGPTARTDLPVREVVVTGPRIAFRSTLERPAEEATIRDGKEIEGTTLPGKALVLIGLGGLLVGTYPLARSAYPLARQLFTRPQILEERGQRKHLREELAALKQIPLRQAEDFERVYRGIYESVRDHVGHRFGVDYAGLTSQDAEGLRAAGVPEEVVTLVQGLVEECEEVRYRRDLPSDAAERARKALSSLERLVAI